jgi:hypothetical protein
MSTDDTNEGGFQEFMRDLNLRASRLGAYLQERDPRTLSLDNITPQNLHNLSVTEAYIEIKLRLAAARPRREVRWVVQAHVAYLEEDLSEKLKLEGFYVSFEKDPCASNRIMCVSWSVKK